MSPRAGLLAAALSILSPVVTAGSTDSIGSDLAIITHNDLYGKGSTRDAAAVAITTPYSNAAAASRCTALESTLWDPDNCSGQDLSFLRYLEFSKTTDSTDAFWIKGSDANHCRGITRDGKVKSYSCNTKMPALCSNTGADTSKKLVVSTGNSEITGYRDNQAFRFLGIKYAESSRFSQSTYLKPAAKLDALAYGPRCYQAGCGSLLTCSEDCLSLNIWTPFLPSGKAKANRKKTVLVYIHGGSYTSGSGADTKLDGSALASRGDVVAVTINYRLGSLGFLALEGTSVNGNFGLQDSNIALDWLKNHIEDFGGDKNKIVIFGQSAGSSAVRALLASPVSKDKIAGAIMQSTPQGLGAAPYSEYLNTTAVSTRSQPLLSELKCLGNDVVACLRKVDPIAFINAKTIAANPVADGKFLPRTTLDLTSSGPKYNIPILAGVLRDDGSPFTTYPSTTNVTVLLASQGFPAAAIQSSGAFPIPENSNTTLSLFNLTSRIATDGFFRCGAQSTANLASKNKIFKKVYHYEFDRSYMVEEWNPNPDSCIAPKDASHPFGNPEATYYRCHSGELYTVFGTIVRENRPLRDDNDIPFSQYVLDSWTAFARTGNPVPESGFLNARGFTNTTKYVKDAGKWEPVGETKTPIRVLSVPLKNEGWREEKQCDVLGLGLNYYADK